MKNRCYNKNDEDDYKHYGAKGVRVCDEWRSNSNSFVKWALTNGYSDDLTIDRIDPTGNYEPENCRWISLKDQNRNKRNNLLVTINGVTKIASEWCEEFGINKTTFSDRIKAGWNPEELILPPKPKKILFDGKITTFKELEEETGINARTIRGRRRLGWPESRWLEPVENRG